MSPRAQADGDPGVTDHTPLIEQLERWADQLSVYQLRPSSAVVGFVIASMRQVAADLAGHDEVTK